MGRGGPLTGPPSLGPRVVVGGISGVGKTTLARELARRLDAPHVELDAHVHGPGWVERPDDAVRASVAEATAGERWVVDGNYVSRIAGVVWTRATTFVWLDYARWVGTARTVRRTAVRLLRRHELWNGNRERLRQVLDPGHPIRWSWEQHADRRAKFEAAVADPRWAHLDVVRLRSPRQTRAFLGNRSLTGRPQAVSFRPPPRNVP